MISFCARCKPAAYETKRKTNLNNARWQSGTPSRVESARAVRPDRPEDVAATGDYLQTLQRATAEVVRKQAAIGVDIVSDGEFGKSSWSNYVLNRISGFEIRPNQLRPAEWLGRDLRTVRRRDRQRNAERTHRPADGSVRRADRVSRSSADTPRDRQFSGGSKRSDRPGGFFDRGGAGEHRLRRRE